MHYPLVANDGQQYGVLKKKAHTHIHNIKSDCDSQGPKDPILMLGYMSLEKILQFFCNS